MSKSSLIIIMGATINNPPPFSDKPSWATGLGRLKTYGADDHNPYYWLGTMKYKRMTSKFTSHYYGDRSSYDLSAFKLLEGHVNLKPHIQKLNGEWVMSDKKGNLSTHMKSNSISKLLHYWSHWEKLS